MRAKGVKLLIMQNFDLGAHFRELKAGQEAILKLLNDLSQKNSMPKIYDLVQLEQILHVSKRTIASWLKQELLPHTRLGAKIWISESQLEEFLTKNGRGPSTNSNGRDLR